MVPWVVIKKEKEKIGIKSCQFNFVQHDDFRRLAIHKCTFCCITVIGAREELRFKVIA